MEKTAAHWIVHYRQGPANCRLNFTFKGTPTLADVAKIILKAWGAAGIVMPVLRDSRDPDASAHRFLKLNGIVDVAFTPLVEQTFRR